MGLERYCYMLEENGLRRPNRPYGHVHYWLKKLHNELSLNESGKLPLEKVADTEAEIRCENFNTSGYPVFIVVEEN